MTAKDPKNPLRGVDLAGARHELAGLPERRLDSDWLALDRDGRVALFAGNERGPAIARAAAARKFPVIGPTTYEELHQTELCLGCRVLDDPTDPRPGAPEALAAAGIYTYAHAGESSVEPYRRIAGPSLAADLADLEPVVQLIASLVKLPISFEEAASLQPWDWFRCG